MAVTIPAAGSFLAAVIRGTGRSYVASGSLLLRPGRDGGRGRAQLVRVLEAAGDRPVPPDHLGSRGNPL